MLWRAINFSWPSSVQNTLIQCMASNIMIHFPHDRAGFIVDKGDIFCKKPNTINIIIFGLIMCNESWLVNRVLINRVNDTLKYEFQKNGFVFIVQGHEWRLINGSFVCSIFYKDSLHLVEQDIIKLENQ